LEEQITIGESSHGPQKIRGEAACALRVSPLESRDAPANLLAAENYPYQLDPRVGASTTEEN
jgi:hypothetical protein